MSITYREGLGRPLTYSELDENFRTVESITNSASASASTAEAAKAAAEASAAAAAASAAAAGGKVSLTGNETIAGVKTFSSSPLLPTPIATDSTTKAQTTAGSLSQIRSFGFGAQASPPAVDLNVVDVGGVSGVSSGTANQPIGYASGSLLFRMVYSATEEFQLLASRNVTGRFAVRRTVSGVAGSWVEPVLPTDLAALPLTASLSPGTDNNRTLGTSSLRYSVVYAGTGTINTSDAREKTEVVPLTDAELRAACAMAKEIGTYKWLESVAEKGEGSRLHIGLTVQRAVEIMESESLDPFAYGFICYDAWDETYVDHPEEREFIEVPAEYDADGNETSAAHMKEGDVIKEAWRELKAPAGNRYGFRHDELSLFIAAGFNERLAIIERTIGGG
jgi:hypothetical protein